MTRRRPPLPEERMTGAQRQMTPGTVDGWVRNTATGAAVGQAGSVAAGGSSYTAAVVFARDRFAITTAGAQDAALTYVPLANSPHVYLNGLHLDEGTSLDYTRDGRDVSLLAGAGLLAGDVVDVRYAYYAGAPSIARADDDYLLFDDFDRSNRALDDPVIGPTPTLWRLPNGTGDWVISSNELRPSNTTQENRAYWDIGETSYTLKVDVVAFPYDGGICVRSNGDGDEVYVHLSASTRIDIYTYDGANYTLRVTGATGTAMAAGETVTVVVTPAAVAATASGGRTATWTDATHGAQTQVGLRENYSQQAAFENLRVTW
jgi:hypothetical protein